MLDSFVDIISSLDGGEVMIFGLLILRWWRDAAKDREITQDEWHELASVIVDRILQHKDVGSDDEDTQP